MQHVKAGRLRALAVASPQPSVLTPDVPTFAQQGLEGLDLSTWYGLFGPAKMPADLVDSIARSVTSGAKSAGVRDKMVNDGFEPILNSPADFARFLKADREQWLGVAKAIGFKRES
jgi:tripartite-type tricarboxylate transporter receptor subunit TctC